MKTYWAKTAFMVALHEERQLFIHFQAKSDQDAVRSAIRFARDREKNLKGWVFTCVKAGHFEPEPIEEDGRLIPPDKGWFFEWKYDWPGTLEERVQCIKETE